MSYRNKTYVAFASEDIDQYRLMTAWRANKNIDFDFTNAHDLYTARDTSTRETIRRRLRERLNNTKQVVLLGTPVAKRKGGDGVSFLAYEIEAVIGLNLPVVVAHLDGSRRGNSANYPDPLVNVDYYTMSVTFNASVIKYALDNYAEGYSMSNHTGGYYYQESVYSKLGL